MPALKIINTRLPARSCCCAVSQVAICDCWTLYIIKGRVSEGCCMLDAGQKLNPEKVDNSKFNTDQNTLIIFYMCLVQESHLEFFFFPCRKSEKIMKLKRYLIRHLLFYLQEIWLAICLKFNLGACGCKISHSACGVKSSQISAEQPVRISDPKVCFQVTWSEAVLFIFQMFA